MRDFRTRYGDWAIVAGASEGLGAAFANELAKRGMHLLLVARRADALQAVAERLRQDHGFEVRVLVLDLASPALAESLSDATADLEPGVIVYNAAFVPAASFLELEDDALDQLMRVNVHGSLTLLRTLLPPMRERGRGAVVLMSSLAGDAGRSSPRRLRGQQGIQHHPRREPLVRAARAGHRRRGLLPGGDQYAPLSQIHQSGGTGNHDFRSRRARDPGRAGEGPARRAGRREPVIRQAFRTPAAAQNGNPAHGRRHERPEVTDVLTGFFAPWLVYAAISGLHLALPARRVEGYAPSAWVSGSPPATAAPCHGTGSGNIAGPARRAPSCSVWRLTAAVVFSAPGEGRSLARRPLSRAPREPADVQRPGRCKDAPLPGRGDIPRTQPALVRGASLPRLSRRSLAGSRPLHRALQLVRMRLPPVRARPPLHVRSRRRTPGFQARLGLPRLVPVLLRGGTMVGRGPSQPATTRLAPRRIRARLLRPLVVGARREHADICVQERPRPDLPWTIRAKIPLRRQTQRALQRLLGRVSARQLSGRVPHGLRSCPLSRLAAPARPLALPPLLRSAANSARARRRPALRREIWSAVGAIPAAGEMADRAGDLPGPFRGRCAASVLRHGLSPEPNETVRAALARPISTAGMPRRGSKTSRRRRPGAMAGVVDQRASSIRRRRG